jgi:alkylhydroperoxidase family enzyme
LNEEQAELLEPYRNERGLLNIYRTLAHNPAAARGFLGWGRYVLRQNPMDARLRELAILRTGWLCRSGYEWTQHSRLARSIGMTDEEIERIKQGSTAEGWTSDEALVLRAAEELFADSHVSDATWDKLVESFGAEGTMNTVFVVAHYTQVSMILNSFGIQVEDGQTVDEELRSG